MTEISSSTPISIIFLDIDGVLVREEDEDERLPILISSKGYTSSNPIPTVEFDRLIMELFDPKAVYYLEKLIEDGEKTLKHPVGIVLSSDWRINRNVAFLRELFKKYPTFSSHIIDRTPQFVEEDRSREEEIAYWLKTNQGNKYNVQSFIIFDDHDFAFSNHFPEEFIFCNHHVLEQRDYEVALNSLMYHTYDKPKTIEKTLETIAEFNCGKYHILEEDYESLEVLLQQ
jgi:hypothetical protein